MILNKENLVRVLKLAGKRWYKLNYYHLRVIFGKSIGEWESVFEKQKSIKSNLPTLNLDLLEELAMIEALELELYVQKEAAKHLGISARSMNHKIKTHGLTHPTWKKNI